MLPKLASTTVHDAQGIISKNRTVIYVMYLLFGCSILYYTLACLNCKTFKSPIVKIVSVIFGLRALKPCAFAFFSEKLFESLSVRLWVTAMTILLKDFQTVCEHGTACISADKHVNKLSRLIKIMTSQYTPLVTRLIRLILCCPWGVRASNKGSDLCGIAEHAFLCLGMV